MRKVPGSLPQPTCGIYRTFSATTSPQTTSEITEAVTNATIVRFFSFSSFNPETTTKKNPPFRDLDWIVMRTFVAMCKGLAHFVTIQYRRPG